MGAEMKYKLYTFTGLTCFDGTTRAISLYEVIKKHNELFIPEDIDIPLRCNNPAHTYSYATNTLQLYEDKLFCLDADYYEMESICKCIEDGYVIVPFSRTFFIMDLLPYYEQGLNVVFMTIKDYKQFKKDYSDSLVTVEDKSSRELF